MPIHAAVAGCDVAPYDVEIDARKCLAYAAGMGETADVYLDDARPGGIVAPPAMVVSLEWPASRDIRTMPEFGATPEERRRGVHAVQDTRFHRLIRPGEGIRITGKIVAVKSIRPGALTMTRIDLTASSGEPVATTYTTVISRGVAVAGEDRVIEEAPEWRDDAVTGDWVEVAIPIARELPHIYTECADIWNPIHTERAAALAAGLPDIILHGTCTWALAVREVVADLLGGDPGRLARFTGRFTGMVIPGTTIIVRYAATDWGARYEVIAADGSKAISDGRALFRS
ncbi:MAG: MaoC family dehydratase N-terminal domain-containing protein [Alphaproteobacteria bacterium]|nr:MaoC family dehydratase N-terminal domain-containing protein [Alphaproteobacteria bacterium]